MNSRLTSTKIIPVEKPMGKTPLWAIYKLKKLFPDFKDITVSYAGRLDPMAEGLLLLLIGDENKKRNEYERLKKEYVIEIVLGISTDTFDMLGIIKEVKNCELDDSKIRRVLDKFVGKQKQQYPPYSSKPVMGKPLFWWARNDRISEIELPTRDVEIEGITLLQQKRVMFQNLYEKIKKDIQKVEGDFRQKEIIDTWIRMNKKHKENLFTVLKIKVLCSSGTYMRRLADDIGKRLGCGAICLKIIRTKIGDYLLKDAIKLR